MSLTRICIAFFFIAIGLAVRVYFLEMTPFGVYALTPCRLDALARRRPLVAIKSRDLRAGALESTANGWQRFAGTCAVAVVWLELPLDCLLFTSRVLGRYR